MKKVLSFLAIILVLQSFQCEEDIVSVDITTEQLDLMKSEIQAYIATFPCDETVGCNSIAFGSKPCGGPWEYLVYSNAVDQAYLEEQVLLYNEMQNQYNIQTGAVSDCAVVGPPATIGCVNGVCGILP